MRCRKWWLLTSALASGALPAGAQAVPASSSTIATEMQQSSAGDEANVIYVMNYSSQAIVVSSVRLMECENVQGSCGTRRTKHRVPPGGRVIVQRVRPRSPDQPFGFRYTFTWEAEATEGPTAQDVAKDRTALVVDTVMVTPKVVDLKAGETLDLSQVLVFKALNSAGQELRPIFFFTRIVLGEDVVSLDATKLTGKSVGTAALLVWASTVNGPTPPTHGASQILIQVKP